MKRTSLRINGQCYRVRNCLHSIWLLHSGIWLLHLLTIVQAYNV